MLTRNIKWLIGGYGLFSDIYLHPVLTLTSPLPEEMFFYARADTHYLLYIYDNLRNELIDQSDPSKSEGSRLDLVLQKSKETSLLRYERPIYEEKTGKGSGGWFSSLAKQPALFTKEQFAVFRAVHAWRDKIARNDDDSTNYVMPNHVVFTIARLMPTDMVSLYGAVHPISYNVKSRATELLELVKTAKATGANGPSMMDVLRPDSVAATMKVNLASAELGGIDKLNDDTSLSMLANEGQLRSEKSAFWGNTFGSSIWDPPPASASDSTGLRLAVPLPQLASDVFASSSVALKDERQVPSNLNSSPRDESAFIDNNVQGASDDDKFIIKNNRKRKNMDISTETGEANVLSPRETGGYDISLNEEEEESAREKAARKAERKTQKKLDKLLKKRASTEGTEAISAEADEEQEPFDYSKANSVLHGKRNGNDQGAGKRKKPFDPYSKSENAPKGMRRVQSERPGKSLTFKS